MIKNVIIISVGIAFIFSVIVSLILYLFECYMIIDSFVIFGLVFIFAFLLIAIVTGADNNDALNS